MHERILIVGTGNRKKGRELASLFEPLGLRLQTLADFPNALHVVEDGQTFADNAALKATQQAKHLGHWVVADDSGLEVDALAGLPGVCSARFSGPGATDLLNNQLLLEKMQAVPLEQRGAQFVCHMTLADPSGAIRAESEAACRGRVRFDPEGDGGFGYDPLFEILEYHHTFGLLPPAVKSCISHRARASRLLIPHLRELIRSGHW
jgi:XTP/dITP diphosphohydrolase